MEIKTLPVLKELSKTNQPLLNTIKNNYTFFWQIYGRKKIEGDSPYLSFSSLLIFWMEINCQNEYVYWISYMSLASVLLKS